MSSNVTQYKNQNGNIVKVRDGRPNASVYADSSAWQEVSEPVEEPTVKADSSETETQQTEDVVDPGLSKLIERANELGIAANRSWKAETIQARIDEAVAAQSKD